MFWTRLAAQHTTATATVLVPAQDSEFVKSRKVEACEIWCALSSPSTNGLVPEWYWKHCQSRKKIRNTTCARSLLLSFRRVLPHNMQRSFSPFWYLTRAVSSQRAGHWAFLWKLYIPHQTFSDMIYPSSNIESIAGAATRHSSSWSRILDTSGSTTCQVRKWHF